jgi:hypothetical protein
MLATGTPTLLEQLVALGGAELFLLPLRHRSTTVRVACLRVINLVLAHPTSIGVDDGDVALSGSDDGLSSSAGSSSGSTTRRRKSARERSAAAVARQTAFASALVDIMQLHVITRMLTLIFKLTN